MFACVCGLCVRWHVACICCAPAEPAGAQFLERGAGVSRGVVREVLNHRLCVAHPNIVQVWSPSGSRLLQQEPNVLLRPT